MLRSTMVGKYRLVTEDFDPHCGDNPKRPEYIISEGELKLIMPKMIKAPAGPVDVIIRDAYAKSELSRYQRLCWQLAACLVGALLLDVVLIIWLIRLGS